MAHIFLSYSRKDLDFARYLKSLLESEGFAVWMDEVRLSASARWWKTIEHSIDTCSACVVIMSPDSAESDWVERELLRAEAKSVPIFPVLYRGEPWSRLANIQYEDMRDGLRATLSPLLVAGLQTATGDHKTLHSITFEIIPGLLTEIEADVVVLPFYGNSHYGGARAIATVLETVRKIDPALTRPALDTYSLIETGDTAKAKAALFLGMPHLREVGYHSIREFGQRSLATLSEAAPDTEHVLMTIHGPGTGLDEIESVLAQFGGFLDALEAGTVTPTLKRITIVERDRARAGRLRGAMEQYLDGADYAHRLGSEGWAYGIGTPEDEADTPGEQRIAAAGQNEETAPYIYVAMSPDKRMNDLFYYGIQGAAHALGLLCVRINDEFFSPDVLDHVHGRIDGAVAVIAEVSDPRPIVFLQLGYAWGAGRPTILVASETDHLPFEPDGHNCLTYESIKDLEEALRVELAGTLRTTNTNG